MSNQNPFRLRHPSSKAPIRSRLTTKIKAATANLNLTKLTEDTPVFATSLNYWNAIKIEASAADWEQTTHIFWNVLETVQKLYDELGRIPSFLQVSELNNLRSSIVIPLRDDSMAPLASRDSRTGHYFFEAHKEFRCGKRPSGIAGICASRREPILITDLSDPLNDDIKYFTPPFFQGGILSLPIFARLSGSKLQEDCIAVLSIASSEPGFFKKNHITAVRKIATEIKTVLLDSKKILPRNNPEDPLRFDKRILGWYDKTMRGEREHDDGQQIGYQEKILSEIISDLREGTGPGKKPWQAIQLLETFKVADSTGITVNHLSPFFDNVPDKASRIASVVANLNARYLKPRGLHIEGNVTYNITQNPLKK